MSVVRTLPDIIIEEKGKETKQTTRLKQIIDDTYSRLLGDSAAKLDRNALIVLHALLSKTPYKVY